jgi:hypothetical protein
MLTREQAIENLEGVLKDSYCNNQYLYTLSSIIKYLKQQPGILTKEEVIKMLRDMQCEHATYICRNCCLRAAHSLETEQRRKPIHCTTSLYHDQNGQTYAVMVTTCNDGTQWEKSPDLPWKKLSPIPQED